MSPAFSMAAGVIALYSDACARGCGRRAASVRRPPGKPSEGNLISPIDGNRPMGNQVAIGRHSHLARAWTTSRQMALSHGNQKQ